MRWLGRGVGELRSLTPLLQKSFKEGFEEASTMAHRTGQGGQSPPPGLVAFALHWAMVDASEKVGAYAPSLGPSSKALGGVEGA